MFQNADRRYLALHSRNAWAKQKQRFPLPSTAIIFLMTCKLSDRLW